MDYEYHIPAAGPIRIDDAVEEQAAEAMTWALMGADEISRARRTFLAWAANVTTQLSAPMPAVTVERVRKSIVNIERAALGLYALTPEPVDMFGADANRWIAFFRQHGATIDERNAAAQLVHVIVGVKGI